MIDLHTHTDRSDGTASPPQLVHDAKAMGLQALGITDHDTLEGYDIAAPLAAEAGLELICGIELSTRPAPTPDGSRPPSVHLLGYFLQEPASPGFRQWIRGHQDSRRERNRKLIAKLNSLGVEITLEEVQVLGKHLTGRPHFAKVLLRKGYVKTNQEAFDRYLADNASASVEREEPELVEGVRRIRDGGGMPSLAHPVRLPERDRASLEKLLRTLIDNGLQGLEVYHSEHSPEDTALYKELAAQFQLIETGGTDFHGDNKPSIHLGTGKGHNVNTPYELLENMRRGVAEFASRRRGRSGVSMVRAGDKLADVLMRPLNFHDGEVLKLILDRRGPTLTVDVLLTNLRARNYDRVPPGDEIPHLVTIRFDGVEDLHLDDFNHQNVIQEVLLAQEEGRLKVEVPSLFGADFSLTCTNAEIVGIRPTSMLTGHPLDAHGQPDSDNS